MVNWAIKYLLEDDMQKKNKKVKRITKHVQLKVKTGVKSGWGDPRYAELTLERYPQFQELLLERYPKSSANIF